MGTVGIFKRFLAVMLTILFSFFLVLLIGIFFVGNLLDENNISKQAEKAFSLSNLNQNNSEVLRTETKKLMDIGIPEEVINKLVESKKIVNIATTYVADYSRYLIYDEEKPILESNTVKVVVTEEINKNGYVLDKKEINDLNKYLDNTVKKVNDNSLSKDQITQLGVDLNTVSKVIKITNSVIVIVLSVLGLLLCVLFIFLSLKSISKTMKYISISFLTIGLLLLLLLILEVKYMSTLISSDGLIDNLLLNMFDGNFEKLLYIGIGLIVFGLILLIVSYLLGRKTSDKSYDILENVIEDEVNKSYKHNLKDHIATDDVDIDQIGNNEEQEAKVDENIESEIENAKEEPKEEQKEEVQAPEVEETKEEVTPVVMPKAELEPEVESEEETPESEVEEAKEEVAPIEISEPEPTPEVEPEEEKPELEAEEPKEEVAPIEIPEPESTPEVEPEIPTTEQPVAEEPVEETSEEMPIISVPEEIVVVPEEEPKEEPKEEETEPEEVEEPYIVVSEPDDLQIEKDINVAVPNNINVETSVPTPPSKEDIEKEVKDDEEEIEML